MAQMKLAGNQLKVHEKLRVQMDLSLNFDQSYFKILAMWEQLAYLVLNSIASLVRIAWVVNKQICFVKVEHYY